MADNTQPNYTMCGKPTKNETRCRNPVMLGTETCFIHSGVNLTGRRKGRRRVARRHKVSTCSAQADPASVSSFDQCKKRGQIRLWGVKTAEDANKNANKDANKDTNKKGKGGASNQNDENSDHGSDDDEDESD